MKMGRTPCRRNMSITQNSYRAQISNYLFTNSNSCRATNCGWKVTHCKSAQYICIKHYCDCSLFVSKAFCFIQKMMKLSTFLHVILKVKNKCFSFCCPKSYKISSKLGFLVSVWDVKISSNDQWRQSLHYRSPALWMQKVAYFESWWYTFVPFLLVRSEKS